MRIAFLASGSPDDRAAWSGTPFYCLRALREQFDVVETFEAPSVRLAVRAARRMLGSTRIDATREPAVGLAYGLALRRRLERYRPDAVFGLASSIQLYGLVDDFNVVHCSDATFDAMRGYYPDWFSGLSDRTIRNGERVEKRVILGAGLALYSSDWAAASARLRYGAPSARVRAAPFGANFDTAPTADVFVRDATCRLLFVGVDWARKGGAVALATLQGLRARGVEAELHVVGCDPPREALIEGVTPHGFLSKNDPSQRERLQRLFEQAAFLIVPSRQEAFGLVFCEASAYGLPSLATETGGIPTIVHDGVNGFLFAPEAGHDPYVEIALDWWTAPERYRRLRETTFERAATDLTWTAWGTRSAAFIRASQRPPEHRPSLAPVRAKVGRETA